MTTALLDFFSKQYYARTNLALNNAGGIQTAVKSFCQEVKQAKSDIDKYFEDCGQKQGVRSRIRPFNMLILGAPGAGKSYVAQKLAGARHFLEINCSHLGDIGGLRQFFGTISSVSQVEKVVLVDEFDVSVAGSSLLRFIIGPIYDGEDFNGKALGPTVFVFAGSYFKDGATLRSLREVQESLGGIDLIKFVFDLGLLHRDVRVRRASQEFLATAEKVERLRSRGQRGGSKVEFVKRLDKVDDFLSRLSGVPVEIPDISSPLDLVGRAILMRDGSESELMRFALEGAGRFESLKGRRYQKRADIEEGLQLEIVTERAFRVLALLQRTAACMQYDKIRLRRSDFAFLVLVPLVFGVRSLEFLCGCLRKVESNRATTGETSAGSPRFELDRERTSRVALGHVAAKTYVTSIDALWTGIFRGESGWTMQGGDWITLALND